MSIKEILLVRRGGRGWKHGGVDGKRDEDAVSRTTKNADTSFHGRESLSKCR